MLVCGNIRSERLLQDLDRCRKTGIIRLIDSDLQHRRRRVTTRFRTARDPDPDQSQQRDDQREGNR
jgi:hypothetical protein